MFNKLLVFSKHFSHKFVPQVALNIQAGMLESFQVTVKNKQKENKNGSHNFFGSVKPFKKSSFDFNRTCKKRRKTPQTGQRYYISE
jgi:hypothetical protein